MLVLVDCKSSGVSLGNVLNERGVPWCHVYDYDRASAPALPPAAATIPHHDLETSLRQLRDLGATAVVPGSEQGVALANEIGHALELPHNDPELAPARRDKFHMVRAVRAQGVPAARTELVHDRAELDRALQDWESFPIVVKPATSAGSEGVRIVQTQQRAVDAFEAVAGGVNRMNVRNDGVVLQEFLDGTMYVVNTVSAGGAHKVSDVYEKRIDEVAGNPVCRHLLLRRDLGDFEESAIKYTFGCLDALGFENGAAHTEIMRTASGPRLVEVNSRLMGPAMPSDTFVPSLGHSQATELAERYADEAGFRRGMDSPYAPCRSFAQAQLHLRDAGTIRAVPGLDRIRRLPGFLGFSHTPRAGNEIKDPLLTTGDNGVCYFSHEDEDVVRNSLEQLHRWEDDDLVFDVAP